MSTTQLTTKELAKKLGAVKKSRPCNVKKSNKRQIFDYLVVLDFEATCWPPNTKSAGKHEIIEFPAVILEVKSGKIVDEFQKYVKPTESPVLSDFCTELTGITNLIPCC